MAGTRGRSLRRALVATTAALVLVPVSAHAAVQTATSYEYPVQKIIESADMMGEGAVAASASSVPSTGKLAARAWAQGWNKVGGQRIRDYQGIGYNYAYGGAGVIHRFPTSGRGTYAVVVDIDVPAYTNVAQPGEALLPPHGGGDAPLSNLSFADIIAVGYVWYTKCGMPTDCHSTQQYWPGEIANPQAWIANSSRGPCCTITPPAKVQLRACVSSSYLGEAQIRVQTVVETRAVVTGNGEAEASFDAVDVEKITVDGPYTSCPIQPSQAV